MSELNKDNLKKKSNSKIYLIIILVYFILALIITSFSIFFYYQNNMSFFKYLCNFVKTDKIEKTPLNEKYALNNIETTEWTTYIRDKNIVDGWESKMTYIEISGLKDKSVQNKINNRIKETAQGLILKEEVADNSIICINVYTTLYSNFSNILSISVIKEIDRFNNDEFDIADYKYENEIKTLNFRLDTGEELKFTDLFTKDASIKRIISQCAYRDLAFDYGMEYMWKYDDGTETYDSSMEKIDYSHIERVVYNVVHDFNNGKEFSFLIRPNLVYFLYNDKYITIDFATYSDYINIYNIVPKDAELYEKGNLEKKDYVFGYPYISAFCYSDKINENTYLIISSPYEKRYSEEEYDEYNKIVYENLDEIKDYIDKDSKKDSNAKIYQIKSVYIDENDSINFYGEKLLLDKKELEDKDIENLLIEVCKIAPEEEFSISFYTLAKAYDVYWINKEGETYYENKYETTLENAEE